MAKSVPIKWRDSDAATLKKTVRQFNAKRARIIKKNPAMKAFLPPAKRVKDLREVIETRVDFNRQIRSLSKFLKKGAEEPLILEGGAKTTKWEFEETKIKVRRIDKMREKELELLNPSEEKGNMHTVEEMALMPKKPPTKVKESDWEAYVYAVEIQASSAYFDKRKRQYWENYKKALDTEFGGRADDIKQIVDMLGPEDTVAALYNDPILELGYIYGAEEAERKLKELREHWYLYVGYV